MKVTENQFILTVDDLRNYAPIHATEKTDDSMSMVFSGGVLVGVEIGRIVYSDDKQWYLDMSVLEMVKS